MTDAMERELEDGINNAVAEVEARPQPLRAVPKQQSLMDNWGRLKTVERGLREQIRQEGLDLHASYETRMVQLHNDHARRTSEALARLEREFADAKQALIDDTQRKLRDHDYLLKQL